MKNVSVFIRSVLFQIAFYLITIVQAVLYLPILILPRRYTIWAPTFWCHSTRFLLRWVAGIRVDVKGLENLPKTGGYIVASKHQSAMETVLFPVTTVPNRFFPAKKTASNFKMPDLSPTLRKKPKITGISFNRAT